MKLFSVVLLLTTIGYVVFQVYMKVHNPWDAYTLTTEAPITTKYVSYCKSGAYEIAGKCWSPIN